MTNSTFYFSNLNGRNGFHIDGVMKSANAGDINNDGFDDLIIGVSLEGIDHVEYGSGYVIFGDRKRFSPTFPLPSLNGLNGFKIYSGTEELTYLGRSVSGAGDINGDGIDDLIVEALRFDSGRLSYVVFGSHNPFSPFLPLSSLNGQNGFRIARIVEPNSSINSVRGAGDVNGDGIDDLIIGASLSRSNGSFAGSSYVVFGSRNPFSPSLKLLGLNGRNGFRIDGVARGDSLGDQVNSAGDINGDGFDDLIIAAPGADFNGSSSGSSYVVFGSRNPFSPSLPVSSLNGRNGFRLDGVDSYSSMSSAGDINGDGFDDLIIGNPRASFNGNVSGSSYVVFGGRSFPSALTLSSLNGHTGFRIDGPTANSGLGISVSNAGDINGDGFDDLIIGACGIFVRPNLVEPDGESYVVFGGSRFPATLNLSTLNGSNGFHLSNAEYDGGNWLVSGAGDVNGDGLDDLIVVTPFSYLSARQGRGYVVFGNRAPNLDLNGINTGLDYNTTFTGSPVALLDRTFSLTDPNSSTKILSTIRGRLTNRPDGTAESLAATTTGTRIKATYSASTGLLKLKGAAPLAQYRRVLASLVYHNSAATSTTTNRTIEFIVDDKAAHTNTSIPARTILAISSNFATFASTSSFNGNATFSQAYKNESRRTNTTTTTTVVGRTFRGGNREDILIGIAEHDQLKGNGGNDFLLGRGGNDTLLGNNGDDFLDGGKGRDYLLGGLGHDRLIGSFGRDQLTGSSGADTFIITDFSESLLSGFDRITDLRIGVDVIDAPSGVDTANLAELGAVAELTVNGISALLTDSSFGARGAAIFTLGDRTFMALNDSTAGFSANSDAIVEITGFRGNLGNLAII